MTKLKGSYMKPYGLDQILHLFLSEEGEWRKPQKKKSHDSWVPPKQNQRVILVVLNVIIMKSVAFW